MPFEPWDLSEFVFIHFCCCGSHFPQGNFFCSDKGTNIEFSDSLLVFVRWKKTWTEKNSDNSHGSTGMFSHQFGRFLSLVTHLPSENSILSNFSSPRGVAILGCESHSQAGSATKLRRCASQLETLCRKSLGQINQPLWPKLSPNYMLMSIFFIWFWMVDCKTIDSMAMVRWSKTIEKPLIPMVHM